MDSDMNPINFNILPLESLCDDCGDPDAFYNADAKSSERYCFPCAKKKQPAKFIKTLVMAH